LPNKPVDRSNRGRLGTCPQRDRTVLGGTARYFLPLPLPTLILGTPGLEGTPQWQWAWFQSGLKVRQPPCPPWLRFYRPRALQGTLDGPAHALRHLPVRYRPTRVYFRAQGTLRSSSPPRHPSSGDSRPRPIHARARHHSKKRKAELPAAKASSCQALPGRCHTSTNPLPRFRPQTTLTNANLLPSRPFSHPASESPEFSGLPSIPNPLSS